MIDYTNFENLSREQLESLLAVMIDSAEADKSEAANDGRIFIVYDSEKQRELLQILETVPEPSKPPF